MRNPGITGILVVHKDSGLPLLYQKLDPRHTDIDPALLSGFFTALRLFSQEIVHQQRSGFEINYGTSQLVVAIGKVTMFAALAERASTDITARVNELLDEFERMWLADREDIDPGDPELRSRLEEFKQTIVARIGIQNIKPKWIPVFTNVHAVDPNEHAVDRYINGENTIDAIVTISGLERSKVIDRITELWASGAIYFKNLLDNTDVVIPTSRLFRHLQVDTPERRELERRMGHVVHLLPEVSRLLDGRTTVGEIVKRLSPEVYDLLDYLFRVNAIEVLTPEKKRILVAKKLSEMSLSVAAKVFDSSDVARAVERALESAGRPEIDADILRGDNRVSVNFDFHVYEGLTPRQVLEVHDGWLKFLREFVAALPTKRRRRFVEQLGERIREDFFACYAPDELEGIDEFTFYLEKLMTRS